MVRTKSAAASPTKVLENILIYCFVITDVVDNGDLKVIRRVLYYLAG